MYDKGQWEGETIENSLHNEKENDDTRKKHYALPIFVLQAIWLEIKVAHFDGKVGTP